MPRLACAVACLALVAATCGEATDGVDAEGSRAVWFIDSANPPTSEDHSFTALVSRVGCNSGVTGPVDKPVVDVTDSMIVISFTVEPSNEGTCPGNDSVPYLVDLGQPIGDRELVDGACKRGGGAETTSHCDAPNDPVRWRPGSSP